MNAAIAGAGWVTPLGSDLTKVSRAVLDGRAPEPQLLRHPATGYGYPVRLVPPGAVAAIERLPRLRRASRISQFAVAAAMEALRDAGFGTPGAIAARMALVFAVSDGGVAYTRRFYEQVVAEGPHAASPLLFPETVYNAPASHLAAVLGIEGAVYSLVGDQAVGFSALHLGAQLLATQACDRVIVVGCEECDWTVCEAYRAWRRSSAPLSEGAAALVLERDPSTPFAELATSPGAPFFRRREAAAALERALEPLPKNAETVLGGGQASGETLSAIRTDRCLGDAPGAGALWQAVLGAMLIREQARRRVLAWAIGANHQAGAAFIAAPGELRRV
jgi:3-oxoacyl-(acyl-carrier-protein) synthase